MKGRLGALALAAMLGLTGCSAGISKPAESPGLSMAAEPVLSAAATGMREYRYEGRLVNDYLEGVPEAVRDVVLRDVSARAITARDAEQNDYMLIFLGRAAKAANGWVIPAGQRRDGEWMPQLYYVREADAKLVSISRGGDCWSINRSYIDAGDGYTAYFGYVPAEERMTVDAAKNATLLSVSVVGSNGGAELNIPARYPYFLYVAQGEGYIKGLKVHSAETGAQLPITLPDGRDYPAITERNMERVLRAAIYPDPMRDPADNLGYDQTPGLAMAGKGGLALWSQVYAAQLNAANRSLNVSPHAPLDQAYLERTGFDYIDTCDPVFTIDAKGFGEISGVSAMLYAPEGVRPVEYAGGKLMPGPLSEGAHYMLYVQAQLADAGEIEFTSHFQPNEMASARTDE